MRAITFKTNILLFSVLFYFFVLSGCSASSVTGSNSQSANETDKFVTITDHAQRELQFEEPPKRIASLTPGDMEIVHALGAEIVGRPNVDKEAISEELWDVVQIGNAHDINFEQVVSIKPDLIIGHAELNRKDVATIESLGLNMMLTNSKSYETILETIEMYGQILQKLTEAQALIEKIEQRKDELLKSPLSGEVNALIIYGTTESFMAALPTSLSGSLLEMAGGVNVASQLPGINNYPDYAQLSMERVIKSNPDIIFFITHGEPEAVKEKFEAELQANSSWENVNAIKNDRLVFLPHGLFGSNPGPRIVDAIEILQESLAETLK